MNSSEDDEESLPEKGAAFAEFTAASMPRGWTYRRAVRQALACLLRLVRAGHLVVGEVLRPGGSNRGCESLIIGVCADRVENVPDLLLQRRAASTSERVGLCGSDCPPDETSVHLEASVLSQLNSRLERQRPEPFRRWRQQFVVVCQQDETGIILRKPCQRVVQRLSG